MCTGLMESSKKDLPWRFFGSSKISHVLAFQPLQLQSLSVCLSLSLAPPFSLLIQTQNDSKVFWFLSFLLSHSPVIHIGMNDPKYTSSLSFYLTACVYWPPAIFQPPSSSSGGTVFVDVVLATTSVAKSRLTTAEKERDPKALCFETPSTPQHRVSSQKSNIMQQLEPRITASWSFWEAKWCLAITTPSHKCQFLLSVTWV